MRENGKSSAPRRCAEDSVGAPSRRYNAAVSHDRDPAALAIDASEWFHDPGLREHVSVRHWRRLQARSELAVGAALAMCARAGVRATWFVTGDLARRSPGLLRELVAAGHEVALAALPMADRDRTTSAWLQDIAAIEGATGVALRGLRSPWPLPAKAWWSEWLASVGFVYDATPIAGWPTERVQELRGERQAALRTFAAWQLDRDQPRLVGLPRQAFAAHYDQMAHGERVLAQWLASGVGGTLLQQLGGARSPAPVRASAAAATRQLPSAKMPRLAIVVPLKNEESGIESLACELDAVTAHLADLVACEFVLVDDGSSDRTWALLRQHFAQRANATLVQHDQNRGVAAAIASGLHATDAELVASIDGDLSYDPMELRAMVALAASADVVTASPYHRLGGVKNVPGWRLLLSRTLSAAYRVLLGSPVRTWTSCFRVYRRAFVVDLPLTNPGFLGTAELLVRVLRRGGRVAEHPCVLEARLFGVSKMRVLRTILGHVRLLWLVAWRRVR